MPNSDIKNRSSLIALTGGGSYLDRAVSPATSEYPRANGSNGHHANGSGHGGSNGTKTANLRGDAAKDDSNCSSPLAWETRLPAWKRALDVSLTLLTLPVWLPLMIVIGAWIKLVSPGPLFYKQRRVGAGGRHFTILKFRSMSTNAATTAHEDHIEKLIATNASMVKLDNLGDPRVIPGGRWLRASGLDELPQLINVLRGEMSLVGPRPCLPREFDRYEEWQKARVCVPPGLTGYWQVNGKNNTTFSKMIEFDLHYAERMSLALDLAILFATIPALVLQVVESRSRIARDLPRTRELPASPAPERRFEPSPMKNAPQTI